MLQIKKCQIEDFENILPLLRQLWPNKLLDANALRVIYNRTLKSDHQIYVCAYFQNKVAGFGSITIKNNLWQESYTCHIDELIIDDSHRGKGIGTQILIIE
jgi:glucosamine-phosphate N-acetyltransferase